MEPLKPWGKQCILVKRGIVPATEDAETLKHRGKLGISVKREACPRACLGQPVAGKEKLVAPGGHGLAWPSPASAGKEIGSPESVGGEVTSIVGVRGGDETSAPALPAPPASAARVGWHVVVTSRHRCQQAPALASHEDYSADFRLTFGRIATEGYTSLLG